MTPGNLSAHLRKLQAADYIEVTKEFIDKKPYTALALTPAGRDAFRSYLKKVKRFVDKIPESKK